MDHEKIKKLYWHWPQPQPISVPAFAWKCRSAWSRKPRWIQCVVCRNANSRREPFCFLIDAPKQSQTHFFCGSLYLLLPVLIWLKLGVYAFQWPAKNTRIWIRAEQKEALHFFVVSCFCHFFLNTLLGTITYPYDQGKLKSMIFSFFRFGGIRTRLFPGGLVFSEMFLFLFFSPMLRSFSLFFSSLRFTHITLSFSSFQVMLFSFVSFQPAVMLKDDIANVGSRP